MESGSRNGEAAVAGFAGLGFLILATSGGHHHPPRLSSVVFMLAAGGCFLLASRLRGEKIESDPLERPFFTRHIVLMFVMIAVLLIAGLWEMLAA
jgi:hypothetical protein